MDLSVLIPARNEMFLKNTVEDVLKNMRGDTEIIIVADGNWPNPPLKDHKRVHLIYHGQSIGQRAATNEAARLSNAKFIMKLDAHCAVDEGFDVKLMADCEYDWTVVPRMYNLHAFDWQCGKCGNRTYQGPKPTRCKNKDEKCDNVTDFEMVMVWKHKKQASDYMWFDTDLRFRYFDSTCLKPYGENMRALKKKYHHRYRDWAQDEVTDQMTALGACWMMHQDRFWELGGCDEKHGSWGQLGVEIACKSWLSGGRQVVNKKTGFAHMFRTQDGFSFPYPNRGSEQEKARQYSRDLWLNDRWDKAVYPLSWLIEKFAPVPGWHDQPAIGRPVKGIVYYTDNQLKLKIAHTVQKRLRRISKEKGIPIVSASLKPMPHFGETNVHLSGQKRGYLTMFKQILAGLEASDAEIIFFAEHDVLYHPSHFNFVPPEKDKFYYNVNVWRVRAEDGHALKVDDCKQTSGLCAYQDLLIEHYRERIRRVEEEGFTRAMGFEPGTHGRAERVDDYKAESWESEIPIVDIRHDKNLSPSRWQKDQFRNQRFTEGWTEADEIPGWGPTEHILKGMK